MATKLNVGLVKKKPDESTPPIVVHKDPINREYLQRLKQLEEELPVSLAPAIEQTREFFLREVAPTTLGAFEGLRTAYDLLQETMGVSVDASDTTRTLKEQLSNAINIKIFFKVANLMNLNGPELEMFKELFLVKYGLRKAEDERDKEILSAVQQVLSLQRKTEGADVPMQQLQKGGPARRSAGDVISAAYAAKRTGRRRSKSEDTNS